MKNVAIRAASGAVYVALIVFALLLSSTAYCWLCLIFGLVAVAEFDRLGLYDKATGGTPEVPFAVTAIDVFGIICLLLPMTCTGREWALPILPIPLWLIGLTLWVFYIVVRFTATLYQRGGTPVKMLSWSVMGQIYIGLGLVSSQILSTSSTGLVLFLFILIWLNDTGAFIVGSAIGRVKLFPRL